MYSDEIVWSVIIYILFSYVLGLHFLSKHLQTLPLPIRLASYQEECRQAIFRVLEYDFGTFQLTGRWITMDCFLVYIMMLSQLHTLYSIEWKICCECWIGTDVKGLVIACFKVLSQHLTGEIDGNHRIPNQQASRPKIEFASSRTWSRSGIHSTVIFSTTIQQTHMGWWLWR